LRGPTSKKRKKKRRQKRGKQSGKGKGRRVLNLGRGKKK